VEGLKTVRSEGCKGEDGRGGDSRKPAAQWGQKVGEKTKGREEWAKKTRDRHGKRQCKNLRSTARSRPQASAAGVEKGEGQISMSEGGRGVGMGDGYADGTRGELLDRTKGPYSERNAQPSATHKTQT